MICCLFFLLLCSCGREEATLPQTGNDVVNQELSPSERAEFADLRKFYITFLTTVDTSIFNLPGIGEPEDHLQLPEAETATRAQFEGLKQGVHTLLFLESMEGPANVDRADGLLAAAGAPLLSELQAKYHALIDTIFRRGFIENDTEFYLVREIADDNPKFYPLLELYEFGPR